MDTKYTIEQLLDRYLSWNAYPDHPYENVTGNLAIYKFIMSLHQEEKQPGEETREVLPGTTLPLPSSPLFDKDTFLTLYTTHQSMKKTAVRCPPRTYVR